MKDFHKLSAMHTSEAAAKRVKKRNAAQFRLKLYGIMAIAFAGLALVSLLATVVGGAAGALRENYVTLPIMLDAEKLDPKGSGDPKVIGKADFAGLTKGMLRETFPQVKNRKEKRKLYDVVSSGAAFELRESVMANPELVGQEIEFRFLASDVSDLYLKGFYGDLNAQPHQAALEITKGKKDAVEVSFGPNVLGGVIADVQTELGKRANRVQARAQLQQNGITAFEQALAAAQTDEDKANAQKEIESRTAQRDLLAGQAADLLERSQGAFGSEKLDKAMPSALIRIGETGWIKLTELTPTGGKGKILSPIGDVTSVDADQWDLLVNTQAENARKVSDSQIVWLETLKNQGAISDNFNWRFFSSGDSREPELAGIKGAFVGSALTMLVTFFLAFPIGVLSAIYLEEFAPKNRFTDFVEVNINNLAAVPSIVFGLLGLSIFLGVFGVPRSAPLAGGIVLALMTLPTIIIASRAAIRAVPPSIRDAALGLGASRLQTSFHHVLPLAMPGVLTGSIIGMAQALGETAPLIMIGMVAFIVDVPTGITDSATVLPVQVFRWADFPERAFESRTAAAICVLLIFLVLMNALAVFMRKRFERRW